MKRNSDADSNCTKRIVLGVQRMSLRAAKRTPSPSSQHSSMDIIRGDTWEGSDGRSSTESEGDQLSSSEDSNMEWDQPRRSRSNSEPRTSNNRRTNYAADDDDIKSEGAIERTWSLPRIIQLQEEERIMKDALTTQYPRLLKSKLHRRVSDPQRSLRNLQVQSPHGGADPGYSAGCECDSDMEDQAICIHCYSGPPQSIS